MKSAMVHVTGGFKIAATLTKLLGCNIQVFPNGQKYEGQWANDMRRARRRDHGQMARLACQSTLRSTCHFILRQKRKLIKRREIATFKMHQHASILDMKLLAPYSPCTGPAAESAGMAKEHSGCPSERQECRAFLLTGT